MNFSSSSSSFSQLETVDSLYVEEKFFADPGISSNKLRDDAWLAMHVPSFLSGERSRKTIVSAPSPTSFGEARMKRFDGTLSRSNSSKLSVLTS